MFIISKRNFLIQRSGAEPYLIKKDFIGEIPEDVASNWLVQAAIDSGTIAAPTGTKDTELREAAQVAEEKEQESDKRPDAEKKGTKSAEKK